jgi:nucleoid DNA-binding protein
MKRETLITMLSRGGLPRPAAADQLDRMVHQIVSRLKEGKPVNLPGLGRFNPGPRPSFEFEAAGARGGKGRGRGRG